MNKRTVSGPSSAGNPKRQKLSDGKFATNGDQTKDIKTSRDLQRALSFQQGTPQELRNKLAQAKAFLGAACYGENEDDKSQKRDALLVYMKTVTPPEEKLEDVSMPDVFRMWSFAAESHNESLMSAIPALLALLLKTMSSLIEFREIGNQLCRSVLKPEHLKLVELGLTAHRPKEHLISPCLRLLTEAVSFDGGAASNLVYGRRSETWKRLEALLGMKRGNQVQADGTTRPSVRTNGVKYALANLRFQSSSAKADLISQPGIVRGIFQDIRNDPEDLVRAILKTVKESVVDDDKLVRNAKSKLLNEINLAAILAVSKQVYESEQEPKLNDLAYDVLKHVCGTVDGGVLIYESGWYPPKRETEELPREKAVTGYQQKYTENVPVRNSTLSSFLQALRPFADDRDRELCLQIFKAAPELVADYFLRRRNFAFDPKLTSTWIGFSSFIFASIQLPVPQFEAEAKKRGSRPPDPSIVLESVLPQPVNQKALTKCLNSPHELVRLMASRILIVSLLKLKSILAQCAAQRDKRWKEFSTYLGDGFALRCPEFRHIFAAYRQSKGANPFLSEALARLMNLYYQVTPQLALKEKVDLSAQLTSVLSAVEEQQDRLTNPLLNLQELELDNLLGIASSSTEMRWWNKSDGKKLSPFTSILRLYASKPLGTMESTEGLLAALAKENFLFQHGFEVKSLMALRKSLQKDDDLKSEFLFDFLDNCIMRFTRKQVKYLSDLNSLKKEFTNGKKPKPTSLFFMAIAEQWPHYISKGEKAERKMLARWAERYLQEAVNIGEDYDVLKNIREQIAAATEQHYSKGFRKDLCKKGVTISGGHQVLGDSAKAGLENDTDMDVSTDFLDEQMSPPIESENRPELNSWSRKEVLEAVEDGTIGKLIMCLCSEYGEVRLQAQKSIRRVMEKIKTESFGEWKQLYILLGEVLGSCPSSINKEPMPNFFGAFASQGVLVSKNPLHFMYVKFSEFMNKAPSWTVRKLPSQWMSRTMLHAPQLDDKHFAETEWVIDLLIDGLRTPLDMEHYRKSNVFERVLSFTGLPMATEKMRLKAGQLLYRAALVDGSTTLITRCGVLGWIEARLSLEDSNAAFLECLQTKILESCDEARVEEWKNNTGTSKSD